MRNWEKELLLRRQSELRQIINRCEKEIKDDGMEYFDQVKEFNSCRDIKRKSQLAALMQASLKQLRSKGEANFELGQIANRLYFIEIREREICK